MQPTPHRHAVQRHASNLDSLRACLAQIDERSAALENLPAHAATSDALAPLYADLASEWNGLLNLLYNRRFIRGVQDSQNTLIAQANTYHSN